MEISYVTQVSTQGINISVLTTYSNPTNSHLLQGYLRIPYLLAFNLQKRWCNETLYIHRRLQRMRQLYIVFIDCHV